MQPREPGTPYLVNLERFRELAGLSRAALARAIGVNRETIIQLETTNRVPGLDVALRLCEALDVPHPRVLTDQRCAGEVVRAPMKRRSSIT